MGKTDEHSSLPSVPDEQDFEELCAAWYYFCLNMEDILKRKSKTRDLYTQYIEHNSADIAAEKRMLRYMESHLYASVSMAQLIHNVEQFKEEILSLMEKQEMYEVNELLNSFQKRYQLFVNSLQSAHRR